MRPFIDSFIRKTFILSTAYYFARVPYGRNQNYKPNWISCRGPTIVRHRLYITEVFCWYRVIWAYSMPHNLQNSDTVWPLLYCPYTDIGLYMAKLQQTWISCIRCFVLVIHRSRRDPCSSYKMLCHGKPSHNFIITIGWTPYRNSHLHPLSVLILDVWRSSFHFPNPESECWSKKIFWKRIRRNYNGQMCIKPNPVRRTDLPVLPPNIRIDSHLVYGSNK